MVCTEKTFQIITRLVFLAVSLYIVMTFLKKKTHNDVNQKRIGFQFEFVVLGIFFLLQLSGLLSRNLHLNLNLCKVVF